MQTLSPRTTFPLAVMAVVLLATGSVLAGSHPAVVDGGRSLSSPSVQQGLPATQSAWQPAAAQPAYRFAHLGSAAPYNAAPYNAAPYNAVPYNGVPYNGVAAGYWQPGPRPWILPVGTRQRRPPSHLSTS